MQIVSTSRYIRISPKKASFLADSIKKLTPKAAVAVLSLSRDKSSIVLSKAIKQALSDATNNYKLNENNIIFNGIVILKGPFFKRWQPVARGMAHQIKKRTTHIKIILKESDKAPKEVSGSKKLTKDSTIGTSEITEAKVKEKKGAKPKTK